MLFSFLNSAFSILDIGLPVYFSQRFLQQNKIHNSSASCTTLTGIGVIRLQTFYVSFKKTL